MSFAGTEPADFSTPDSIRGLTGLKASPLLTRAASFLAEQGIQSYVVGGLIRDTLLGRDTADIDIAVAADALEVAQRVATALGGKYVILDRVNGVGRVVMVDETTSSAAAQRELDFSTLEGSIEQDLARRDFTVDAMAVELSRIADFRHARQSATGTIPGLIDPFKGTADLRNGVIRAVTGEIFESDAARLLRAVRLAAELNFTIDNQTEALIRRDSHFITGVAGERIREELLRLLAVPRTEQLLPYLDELGLLTALIPELEQAKGVEQPGEHFWNVFDHSLRTVSTVDFLLGQGAWEYGGGEVLATVPWPAVIARHFDREVSHGSTRRLLLKLAALLHDVAKPRAKAFDADGRMRFLGHAIDGAAIAAEILERLRFSAREIKLVETLIKHHLRPTQMSQEGLPTRRAIYRYFRDTGEAGIDTLYLSLADHLATRGPNLNPAAWQEHTRIVAHVLTSYLEQENNAPPPRLVDGNDLIKTFGMSPGPEIGEILEAVREAQASGDITNREEALSFIKGLKKHA